MSGEKIDRKILYLALSLMFASACAYHIQTAIPPQNVITHPALVGVWESGDDRAEISAGDGSDFRLNYSEGGGATLAMMARIGRLGTHTVLETWPVLQHGDDDWPVGRMLFVVELGDNEIKTWSLRMESLRAWVEHENAQVPHLIRDDDVIITAPTSELVTNLTNFLSRPDALDEEQVWRRVEAN